MKAIKIRTLSVLTVLLLTVFSLFSCLGGGDGGDGGSGGGNNDAVIKTYDYAFTLGSGDYAVELAYHVKTSTDSDGTIYDVYPKVNGTVIGTSGIGGGTLGSDGIINVIDVLKLKLEGETLSFVSFTDPGRGILIAGNEFLAGTYNLQSGIGFGDGFNVDGLDTALTLNTDGTGSFLGLSLVYLPLNSTEIVIFNEDGEGLILELNYVNHTYLAPSNSLRPNFILAGSMADYYSLSLKYALDSSYTGVGYCSGNLHLGETTAVLLGNNETTYFVGPYEKDGNKVTLKASETETETVYLDDNTFDYKVVKQYKVGEEYVNYYENGGAFVFDNATHNSITGKYTVPDGALDSDVPAVVQTYGGESTVYVLNKETLNLDYYIMGSAYVDTSDYTVYSYLSNSTRPNHFNRELLISPDGENVYIRESATIEDSVTQLQKLEGATLFADNKVVATGDGEFYLTLGFKYFVTNSYDLSVLDERLAEDFTYSYASVDTLTETQHMYPQDYTSDCSNVHIVKMEWDGEVEYAFAYNYTDGDAYNTAAFCYGGEFFLEKDGATLFMSEYGYLVSVKIEEDRALLDHSELPNNVTYFPTDDGYVTFRHNGDYYLVGSSGIIELIIHNEKSYTSIKNAVSIPAPGATDYPKPDSVRYAASDVLYDEAAGMVYIPLGTDVTYGCISYSGYECDELPYLQEKIIRYNIATLNAPYYMYLYVTDDGYYKISDDAAIAGLPAEFTEGTRLEEFTGTYSSEYGEGVDAVDIILELIEYENNNGIRCMLIVAYTLQGYHFEYGTGNVADTYREPTMDVIFIAYGTFSASDKYNYRIENLAENYYYTVAISGSHATVERHDVAIEE